MFDLGPYDADSKKDWGDLSADELRIERLCDEERYLELHTDIAEKAVQEGRIFLYLLYTHKVLQRWMPVLLFAPLNLTLHFQSDYSTCVKCHLKAVLYYPNMIM